MLDLKFPKGVTGTMKEFSAFGCRFGEAATGNILKIVESRTALIAIVGTLAIVASWLTFKAYVELRGGVVVKHDVLHRGGAPPGAPA